MLGKFLFRWRGVIGVLAFGAVLWLARPTFGTCMLGIPFLLAGLAIRFWASGYIGSEGRVSEIVARQRIAAGPYRLLRHPLYIGNFLLVLGMLLAARPALWLSAVVLAGFVVEYTFIAAAEQKQLASLGSRASGVDSPEPMVDDRRSFLLSRALVEWQTWLVTGAAWGLVVVRALV